MNRAATTAMATDTAWVGLGSNVGVRALALASLREAIERDGVRIHAASRELITRAVGVTRQRDFLNQVLRLHAEPSRSPAAWLELCRTAELRCGRGQSYRWGPRRADADILLLGADGSLRVDDGEALTVPHPELGERPFFCALLAEVDPTLRHPDGWSFAAGRR